MSSSGAFYSFAFGAVVVGGTLYYLLRKYIGGGVCRSRASLKGRTVIVTGANAGIGLETAADLAGRGARVIMACRSVERGEKAAVEVRKRSCNNDVVFSRLDLASLESVRQFAERMLKEEPHIDVLINNAGVCLSDVSRTVDGHEIHFATNHLGPFLLTNLLLDCIKESSSPRIVVVSSRVHAYYEPFDFETVNTDDNTMLFRTLTKAYAQSKLANALFSYSLSKRLEGSGVTVNALHPGFISTEMAKGSLFPKIPFLNYFKPLVLLIPTLFFKTAREGAQTTIYCAVSEELEGVSGKFFADCKEVKLNVSSQDAERLWELSAQLVGLN